MSFEENAIICGDCLDVMAGMPDESITAVLCDPPYGLAFMGKGWDKFKNNAEYQAWVTEWAKELLRACVPGAVGLFFGGTRTFHRLACGLEDAGWEIFDTCMWMYGSGFPKSHNISKAIDRAAGKEREVVGISPNDRPDSQVKSGKAFDRALDKGQPHEALTITAPATEAAETWSGYGTSLKPGYEPIILARKSRQGTYAKCAVEHGSAALWIDGCRVGIASGHGGGRKMSSSGKTLGTFATEYERDGFVPSQQGRWPANVILSHSEGCRRVGVKRVKGHSPGNKTEVEKTGHGIYGKYAPERPHIGYADPDGLETVEAWECVAGCPVRQLDEMSGERKAGGKVKGTEASRTGQNGIYGMWDRVENQPHNDKGGASRFFYCAKASRRERNAGLEGMATESGGTYARGHGRKARRINSGDEWEYVDEPPAPRANVHPTVKPIALTEYLARLIRPPEAYLDDAVLLVPFAGTGSEIIGAIKAGWRNWLGIEISEEYAEIARARIAYWQERIAKDREKRAQMEMLLTN